MYVGKLFGRVSVPTTVCALELSVKVRKERTTIIADKNSCRIGENPGCDDQTSFIPWCRVLSPEPWRTSEGATILWFAKPKDGGRERQNHIGSRQHRTAFNDSCLLRILAVSDAMDGCWTATISAWRPLALVSSLIADCRSFLCPQDLDSHPKVR